MAMTSPMLLVEAVLLILFGGRGDTEPTLGPAAVTSELRLLDIGSAFVEAVGVVDPLATSRLLRSDESSSDRVRSIWELCRSEEDEDEVETRLREEEEDDVARCESAGRRLSLDGLGKGGRRGVSGNAMDGNQK